MWCNYIGINSSTHNCKSILKCQERQSGGTECSKNFHRPGLCPGPRWGAYSAPPDTQLVGMDTGCPLSNYPLLSALWTSLLLFPTPKLCPHLIQAGDAPETHIGYDRNLYFPVYRLAFTVFASKRGSGFSYSGLYLNSSQVCCLCLCNLRNSVQCVGLVQDCANLVYKHKNNVFVLLQCSRGLQDIDTFCFLNFFLPVSKQLEARIQCFCDGILKSVKHLRFR